jgi:hypothetical protein
MDRRQAPRPIYAPCIPTFVRPARAKCPKCGMDLLPEGTRFGLLQHMISSPFHLAVMLTAMLVLMAAAMMMMR